MSHLETSNSDSAQSKDVWNENLEILMSSAVCLLSADCFLGQILFRAAGHLENFPSCCDLILNFEFLALVPYSNRRMAVHVWIKA